MMMNGAWSRPPTSRITTLSDLGDLGEKISEGAGECSFVCKLSSHPGWLYKAYRAPSSADNVSRLDRLIGLPGQMSVRDRLAVDTRIAWPSARVVNSANQTIGVLLPMAPEAYKFEMALPGGRTRRKYLEVDVLALSGARQRQMGLPPQSLADRISVCASIADAADLLERRGLVYLDWSYANIFWRLADHSAYLIDLDGASFGPRPQIHAPQWDDPHVPLGTTAGNSSDRYRVALLITTCLTGKRIHDAQARTELSELRKESAEIEQLAELLILALTMDPSSRPEIARIKAALDAVNGAAAAGRTPPLRGSTSATSTLGGVNKWNKIEGRSPTRANPPVTPPRTTSPPAPKPEPLVPATTSSASPYSVMNTGWSRNTGHGAGTPVRPPYQSRTPARPPASGVAVAVKAAAVLIAIIIICVIIASL
jgi:hypothetical protein